MGLWDEDFGWGDFGGIDLGAYDPGFEAGDFQNLGYDSDTGEFVELGGGGADTSTMDPALYDTLDYPVPNVEGGGVEGSTNTTLSDQLRSRAADPYTPGTEPFSYDAMADPTASINSAAGLNSGSGWGNALAKGLQALAGSSGVKNALAHLAGGGVPGLAGSRDIPGLMSLAVPGAGSAGQAREYGGAGGVPSAGRFGADTSGAGIPRVGSDVGAAGRFALSEQGPVSAALSRLAADSPGRIAMQGPIPTDTPQRFSPISMNPQVQAPRELTPAQRLSGLQALLAERRG